jgi:adenosine deaminase
MAPIRFRRGHNPDRAFTGRRGIQPADHGRAQRFLEETTMTSEISAFIAGLPKAELHMHLEGSLEPETLMALAARNRIKLPYDSADALRAAYRFDGLQSFLDLFYLGLTTLRTFDDFYQMTDAYLERAARDNVRYAEVFLAAQGHLRRGIPAEVMMEGVLSALADGPVRHGVRAGLIAIVQRQFDETEALDMLQTLMPWRDRVLAIGLGGPEIGNPPGKFARAFEAARCNCGWRCVAHAGEEGGPDYVRDALRTLKVDRVDHGVRCDEPDLMAELKDRGTPLTVCPISNCRLHVFPDMGSHNVRRLHEAGLCVTINSDDPPYFGGYVNQNFAAIQDALGLSDGDLWQFAVNSFRSAFLPPEDKVKYLAELDRYRAACPDAAATWLRKNVASSA